MQEAKDCLIYIVNEDAQRGDHVHVTEVWETAEDHAGSLKLEAAKELIAQALPLIQKDQVSRSVALIVSKAWACSYHWDKKLRYLRRT